MLIQTDPKYTPVHPSDLYYARITKNCPGLVDGDLGEAIKVLHGKVSDWCATNPRTDFNLPELMGSDMYGFRRAGEFENTELSMLCGVEYENYTGSMAHERLAAELILAYVVSANSQYNFEREYETRSVYLCVYTLAGRVS